MKNILFAGAAVLLLTACQSESTPKSASESVPPIAVTKSAQDAQEMMKAPMTMAGAEDIGNRGEVMMAIQAHGRLAIDLEEDEVRNPAAVLEFANIWPGMTVVELEAGGGYYTDLLNHIVGKDGKVYMQNPPSFDVFLTEERMNKRLGVDGKRLANTEVLRADFGELGLADNSADVATWFLGPHEMFYTVEGTDGMGDAQGAYTEAFRVLKPGGKFILMDHKAAAGSPESTGGDTHRIDPALVQKRAEEAGFVLSETSDIHASKTDDYNLSVFDPKVRRKTDRFLHMYVKPE